MSDDYTAADELIPIQLDGVEHQVEGIRLGEFHPGLETFLIVDPSGRIAAARRPIKGGPRDTAVDATPVPVTPAGRQFSDADLRRMVELQAEAQQAAAAQRAAEMAAQVGSLPPENQPGGPTAPEFAHAENQPL